MEKSKINSFAKRLISAVVLIPVVVGCVMYGYTSMYLLAMLGAALLSWEWATMVPNKRSPFYAVTYFFIAVTAILLGSFEGWIGSMVAALALVFLRTGDEKHRWLLLLGIPYISIGIWALVEIYTLYGAQMVLWFLFLVWGVDIGGYVFGCTLKGPKLAPKISPNKTWAGLFGGMILAMAVSYGVCWYFGAADWSIFKFYLVMAAILAVIAQIGDLVESAIKRYLGLKDSSNLIPGHGGFFDRVDGLIFAAPFAVLMLRNLVLFAN